MILSYKCTFGVPMPFDLTGRFGDGVELEGFEFVNAVPIEWRLTTGNSASEWQEPFPDRKTFPFHDLQIPRRGGTGGTRAAGLSLETRGIGECTVLVWLREGTYRKKPETFVASITPAR